MTTNYASLGCVEGDGQNVRQLEQQRGTRWSDEVISSPDSASVFKASDDLGWRKSSSSFSNMTDGSESYLTPADDEEMSGWARTANDVAEVDGSRPPLPEMAWQNPTQLSGDHESKPDDYDDMDDINCNSVSFVGRDRRGMYVPSHMAGPELDVETEEFPPPDAWKKPRLVSSQTEVEAKIQRSQQLKFERVESMSSSSSSQVVLVPGLQTERAEAQIISTPPPRQLTMKTSVSSRSFDRQSSSSVTSSSSVASPATDRGECLVVHANKRSEITVKTKSQKVVATAAKVDSYHGPKYGGSVPHAGAPGDGEAVGKNQTNQSRPSRRSRNDVAVVKAIVHDTREYIQATLVESRPARNEDVDLVGDHQMLENDESLSLPYDQQSGDELMAVDVVSTESEGKLGVNRRKGVPSVNWATAVATANEAPDDGNDDESADQLLPSQQELDSVEEEQDETIPLPSLAAATTYEDTEEEEQERQITHGDVKMEVERNIKEEIMDSAAREMVPYAMDESMEETRLERRRSIHPQRKPRENKRKAHPSSSRLPPGSTSPSVGVKENDVQAADAYRIFPAVNMDEFLDTKPLHYYSQDSSASARGVTTPSVLPYPNNTLDLAEKELTRARPGTKSGMDRLKKKTRSGGGGPQSNTNLGNAGNVVQREEPELKSLDTSQAAEVLVIRMDVVLHKIESGYGLTIEGSQPVHVKAVRENGIAAKNGILPGDELVKINGTYVYDWEHESVIRLIKSAGQFLSLTLQRDLPVELAQASSDQLSALAHGKNASRPKASQSLKASETNHQKPKNQSQISQSFTSGGKNVRVGMRSTDGRGGGGRHGGGGDGGSIRNPSPGSAIPSSSDKLELSNKENVSFVPGAPTLLGSTRGRAEQPAAKGTPKPIAVIGMDNDDLSEEEDVPINPIFNDLSLLKQNMAHLAVFLNFLISNSEPAPMLFSMITDYYQSSLRDTAGSATRWAFEIYTTFLAAEAPLKLMVNDGMVISIESVLRSAKDNELRTVFRPAENFVRETILMNHLKDFNNKQSIGLGTMFGVHDLKPIMDRHSELRIVDSTLSSHFERFISDEANDVSQALAFSLATFFRQISFAGGRYSSLLDVCPSFICKDKKVLKYKLKKNYESKGHAFNPHQCTTITKCQNCEKMIWGIGFQGYQCSNCDLVIHRRCADNVWQLCSGTLRRMKDAKRAVRDIMPGRSKPGRDDSSISKSVFHFPTDETATIPDKRTDDAKAKLLVSSNEKVSNVSDDEKQSDSETEKKPTNGRPSSWPNISQETNSAASKTLSVYGQQPLSDPDFDVESELPPLSDVISKEALRKLKGKERKKQEYINELFYTEKTHLRQLKVIERFFRRPLLREESFNPGFISALFQNLDEVIEAHANMNDAFKKLRAKTEVVTEIGDTLLSLFSGENGVKFRQMASRFCRDQLFTLVTLKSMQKKDTRLFQILQEATLNPHSARQELKDLLPREMQRLTKYPLLFDNMCNCTPPETEEYEKLKLALASSKELLEDVNQAVKEIENFRRTQDMQKRLDRKPIESSNHPTLLEYRSLDLTQHKMIYDGELTWRRSPRPVDLHMALFEHFVVLLQKQDDRLVLRCQSTAVEDVKFTYSPIIKLEHLLTKDVATDKRAFFLVNKSNDAPQVHELVAKSKEEKNRWCLSIKDTVERYHRQYSNVGSASKGPILPPLVSNSGAVDIPDSLPRMNPLDVLDLNGSVDEGHPVEALDLATSNMVTTSEDTRESLAVGEDRALPELQQKNALIHKILSDKTKLLSDVHDSLTIGNASTAEELVDNQRKLDVKELIAQSLDEVKRLSELTRDAELKKLDEEETAGKDGVDDDDDNVAISATELLKVHNQIQQLLASLTVGVVNKEADHERLELQARLSAMQRGNDTSNDSSDDRLEMRSLDIRRPPAISRPTSYMAALSETNYRPGPRMNEPPSSVAHMEETVQPPVLTLDPALDDSRLTTQDEWNSDDQQVSTDSVSFI